MAIYLTFLTSALIPLEVEKTVFQVPGQVNMPSDGNCTCYSLTDHGMVQLYGTVPRETELWVFGTCSTPPHRGTCASLH